MAETTPKIGFWRGTQHGAPFLLVLIPFAMLFGVVATEAGLPLSQVMGFSVLVIAGAAQFTAIQLMTENAPTFIVIISALAVNLRMAMYSAALTPYMGKLPLWQRAFVAYICVDQSYACAQAEFDAKPNSTLSYKFAYFVGVIWIMAPAWYLFTWLGAVVGQAIPPEWALDFAVPICFLAIIAPALRTLAHVVAALVSIAGALALIWVPFNLGLIIAAILAMLAGAQTELMMERRK